MTQEYVTVQAPHEGRERREPAQARNRRIVAVVTALGVLIAVAVTAIATWPTPAPEPVPRPTLRTPDAARSTALVYQEWTNRSELVNCLHALGFNYEARIVDHRDLLETAAQYLEVAPATAHPDAPLPMLRQPDLYLGRGGAEAQVGAARCANPRQEIDPSNAAAVRTAVESARADSVFLTTVAEQVWADQHPAEVTHKVSFLRHDHQPADAYGERSAAWSEQLAVVTDAVQEHMVWVPVVTGEYEQFAQSVGLVASGGAVAVRVSGGEYMLDSGTYMSRIEYIRCGPVTMSAAIKAPWGSEENLRDVVQALGTGCSALMEAGFAQAETLAEVYWD